MIIDTSALIAILRNETDAARFAKAIADAPIRRMSAASYLETGIVIDTANQPISSRRVDELITRASIRIEPVTEEQARIARDAYRDFGKGRKNKAQLNFGDCFAYALAKTTGEPLLFKGDDFAATDVAAA